MPNATEQSRYKPGNPFAGKAKAARVLSERLSRPTAHEAAMAEAFPLGPGCGRVNTSKQIDQSVARATKAVEALREAEWQEARAEAWERGEINAQGRKPAVNADAARDRREALKERERAAREAREGKERWEVRGCVYADSARQFGGGGRKLVLYDHREHVVAALADGKRVPPEVLADYPDLMPVGAREAVS